MRRQKSILKNAADGRTYRIGDTVTALCDLDFEWHQARVTGLADTHAAVLFEEVKLLSNECTLLLHKLLTFVFGSFMSKHIFVIWCFSAKYQNYLPDVSAKYFSFGVFSPNLNNDIWHLLDIPAKQFGHLVHHCQI